MSTTFQKLSQQEVLLKSESWGESESASLSLLHCLITLLSFIDQYVSQSDLKAFNAQFAPAAKDYSIPLLLHNGAKNNESDAGMEAMLDVETVVAGIYPLPSIFLAEGDSNYPGDIFALAFQDLVDNFDVHTRPKVITASYGANEIELTQQQGDSMCQYAQKLSALGTTILVSSGDNGVIGAVEESCPEFNPNYPS